MYQSPDQDITVLDLHWLAWAILYISFILFISCIYESSVAEINSLIQST